MIVAFSSGNRLDFPPPGLSLRWFGVALGNELFIDGLLVSLVLAAASAVLATIAGTGAALAINHHRFRGRSLVQAAVMLPIAMPTIVLGLGLLFTLSIYDMQPGLLPTILGHAVLGLPYVVAMVTAALASYDTSLERASLNLGAGPARTFLRVTLPLIGNGVVAGGVSAFMISLDNISLSLFISKGDTLPLRLMQQLQSYADPSVAAIATVVVGLSAAGFLLSLAWGARRRRLVEPAPPGAAAGRPPAESKEATA
nr:ABC transporter permease [Roseomonas acroporae]